MTLGEKIRMLRTERGWYYTHLAREARVKSVGTLTAIESNRKNPSLNMLKKLAHAFGVSVVDILQDVDGMTDTYERTDNEIDL